MKNILDKMLNKPKMETFSFHFWLILNLKQLNTKSESTLFNIIIVGATY